MDGANNLFTIFFLFKNDKIVEACDTTKFHFFKKAV